MSNDELQLNKLIIKCLEGVISAEEIEQLNETLAENPEACKRYAETVFINSQISRPGNIGTYLFDKEYASLCSSFDDDFWKELAESEKAAPEIEIPKEQPPRELIQKVVYPPRQKQRLNKFSIFTLVNVAAVILFFVILRFAPSKGGVEVAVLKDSINAKWADRAASLEKGERLVTGNGRLMLREGYAELLFDNHARVTVEGPAEFQVVADDRIFLNYGKIYSQIPKEATGFSVYTPNSKIIDLGTEFGVEADLRGETRLHVIQGKTKLIAGQQSDTTSVEVREGEAKKISAVTSAISPLSCETDLFVRKIDSTVGFIWKGQKQINLADIVGGGNGFGTGKLDSGIETNIGRWFESPDPKLVQSKVTGIMSGGGSYNEVSSLALIDGVFVPDSRQGPVQITSTGQTFDGFVEGRDAFWGNIFDGAWHASDTCIKHNLKLNGQTYGTRDNPAISLHSSQGITFDLQAIRQTMPGGKILRFTSLFGVSDTVALDPLFTPNTDGPNQGKVNCWVLVDGKERFNRNSVSYLQGAIEINIDISDEDRFLTLVVTESNDRRAYDWALFAEPFLLIDMDMN